ncbi:hypothetical protein SADUNF_Sadunf14G0006200 [Salix dunnii]|uniref:Uncharacterized protein n=1 Tax=Salix dunnii TaxID=1413687 RepID=A0A835JGV4_9ROSI|nr:hypothetical protein SADUNF_Sadunf14G0006200 [Salix dunnii]
MANCAENHGAIGGNHLRDSSRVAHDHERKRRYACVRDDARGQHNPKPILANPHGQYDYGYASNEDLFWLMRGTNKNCNEERNILKDLPQGRPWTYS